jgi:uncharacterized protein YkwD
MPTYRQWRILFLLVLVCIMSVVVYYRLTSLQTDILPNLDANAPVVPVKNNPPNPPAAPPPESGNDIEQLVTLINQERSANGLPQLALMSALSNAAIHNSQIAASQNTLETGIDPGRLAIESGYHYGDLQQTTISTARLTAADTFARWMNNQNIRGSLLNGAYADIGLGRTPSASGEYYYTMLLATPLVLTAPGADLRNPGGASQSGQSQEMLRLLNDARRAQNLRPLTMNSGLTRAALSHSEDQAARDVMSHEGGDGSFVDARINATGYEWGGVGENVLARGDLHASAAFDQWWNSPDHYINMMNADFNEIGLAYAVSGSGQYYYTMVLATRR